MSDEKQPEYVWAFPPERERKAGRVWLIIGLAVLAVAIAAALFWLIFRPGDGTASHPTTSPTASVSPTASATPSASPSPAPSPTATASPAPQPTSAPTAPPAQADPDLPVFREKVTPRLQDAETGLTFAEETSGQEGVQLADQLLTDAGLLGEAVAPKSIATKWIDRVDGYAAALQRLRSAYESGGDASSAIDTARSALADVRAVLG